MNTEFETLNSKEIEGAFVEPVYRVRDFGESFNNLVGDRIDNMGEVIRNNNEYKIALNKSDKLYNQLKVVLTKEQFSLFREYDEANTYTDAIAQELIYKRGMKDGNKLSRLLQED